jgi:hypothetical protein
MSIVKKTNPHDFTEEEKAFLETSVVPVEVQNYLKRQKQNIGTKVSAYRKVAAAARAEADALLAIRDLDDARGEWAQIQQAREAIGGLTARNRALEGQLAKKDAETLALKAAPALAVHSED